jgi:hypothetical protein
VILVFWQPLLFLYSNAFGSGGLFPWWWCWRYFCFAGDSGLKRLWQLLQTISQIPDFKENIAATV